MTTGYVESDSGHLLVPAHAAGPARQEPTLFLPDGSSVVVDPSKPEIPPFLLHLDELSGRAVPWIAWRTSSGGVDLEERDGHRFIDCLDERACGMCATPLGYWIAFLVTADDDKAATARRHMTEPAMHKACARYARAAWWTDRTHLYVTRSYVKVERPDDPRHPVVAKAAAPKRVERFL